MLAGIALANAASVGLREKFGFAMTKSDTGHLPEADAMRRQVTKLLETAIANLPESSRVVLMLREVEGLSVEETAEVLQVPKNTVKARLAGARHKLQQELNSMLRSTLHDTFTFAGKECEALTERLHAAYITNGRKL